LTGAGNLAPARRERAHTRPRCTRNRETHMRMHRRGPDPEKLHRCRQVSRQARIKHSSVRQTKAHHSQPSSYMPRLPHKSKQGQWQQAPRQPQKSSVYVSMCQACHSIQSRNVTKTNRKHHRQPTSHMPRNPRAIKHRQDHQAAHMPYTVTVDVTQRHACHGHDPRRHNRYRNATSMSPCNTQMGTH